MEKTTPWDCPAWINSAGNNLGDVFATFARFSEEWRRTALDGYSHWHVMQEQINTVTDDLIAKGVIDLDGKILNKNVVVPKNFYIAYLYQNGSAFRLYSLACEAKKIALIHTIDSIRSAINVGNLLVALILMRSIIEHIAHFNDIASFVREKNIPTTFQEANLIVSEINGYLTQRLYGTRVDWEQLMNLDDDNIFDKKKIKYNPVSNRQDRTASQILNSVDALSKKIKGLRGSYEVLCEFAHPNVGMVLALTRSAEPKEDKQGFFWIEKIISMNPPLSCVQEMGPIFSRIFHIVSECLMHFDQLLVESKQNRFKIRAISQIVLRSIIKAQKNIINPYAECPCWSGLKTKFCCGAQSS